MREARAPVAAGAVGLETAGGVGAVGEVQVVWMGGRAPIVQGRHLLGTCSWRVCVFSWETCQVERDTGFARVGGRGRRGKLEVRFALSGGRVAPDPVER